MGKKIDLTGQVFTRLTVVKESTERKGGSIVWECLCDCGNYASVTSTHLVREKTKSCGCLSKERLAEGRFKHGKSNTFEHDSWRSMKARCYNENNSRFEKYGARGISVCERWLNSFENFLVDMGEAPEGLTLDRIDVNGNYCPENCRWADIYTQNFNQGMRRNNRSGRTGVSWSEERQKWVAQICLNDKPTSLGRFDTFEEAVAAREKAELEYMGVTKK